MMNERIVIPMPDGDRCVTTRATLERVVRSLAEKAESIERSRQVPPLLTYPARPIQGGRLELAPPKRGEWFSEPKFNGWRTLVHTPSGTMWNRQGKRLTIAHCFREALDELLDRSEEGLLWADCEALERRHDIARGTLIVLDAVPADPQFTPSYRERRAFLESLGIPQERFSSGINEGGEQALLLTTSLPPCSQNELLAFYQALREANHRLKSPFFEGIVMKKADAPYPVQLRNSTEECRAMIKHRYLT